jgi:hypothetical protein
VVVVVGGGLEDGAGGGAVHIGAVLALVVVAVPCSQNRPESDPLCLKPCSMPVEKDDAS